MPYPNYSNSYSGIAVTIPDEQYWAPGGLYRFVVELGLANDDSFTDVWDTALWGSGVWSGYEPEYLDVTEYVLSVDYRYGKDTFEERMRTGRCVVVFDNAAGHFNPDFGASLPGALSLRPGRWLRVRVTWYDETLGQDLYATLWEGFVHSLEELYPSGGSDSLTRVTAYDFAAMLAQVSPPALGVAVGAGETTAQRVSRILDGFGPLDDGWPWRSIATYPSHTMQSTTLSDNYLEEAHRAADAEGGAFYFEGRTATFRPFNWLQGNAQPGVGAVYPRSVGVQMYPGRGNAGDPEVVGVETEWTAEVLRNDVQMSRSGGSVQRVQDSVSQAAYGVRSWRRLDLENDTDSDVLALAQRLVDLYGTDYQRVTAIVLEPGDTLGQITEGYEPVMLGTRLGDLVRATIDLGPRGWSYTVDAHVVGIEVEIGPSFWRQTLRVHESVEV